jgi:hypothetical protein
MKDRLPVHAYRREYSDSPHAPEKLWEWEKAHRARLLGNAKTFGREVVPCYCADWHALAAENPRLWEAYSLWPASESWEGWQRGIAEYRTRVATAQEVDEAPYGRRSDDPSGAR